MGTRGLVGFIVAGKLHGIYNHCDSYPSDLGARIVRFLCSLKPEEYQLMDRLLREITVSYDSSPSPELQERYSKLGFVNLGVSTGKPDEWYCLLRNLQMGAVLDAIKSGDAKHLLDYGTMPSDLKWLDFTYFIDFENQMLETTDPDKSYKISFENLVMLRPDYIIPCSRSQSKN